MFSPPRHQSDLERKLVSPVWASGPLGKPQRGFLEHRFLCLDPSPILGNERNLAGLKDDAGTIGPVVIRGHF